MKNEENQDVKKESNYLEEKFICYLEEHIQKKSHEIYSNPEELDIDMLKYIYERTRQVYKNKLIELAKLSSKKMSLHTFFIQDDNKYYVFYINYLQEQIELINNQIINQITLSI